MRKYVGDPNEPAAVAAGGEDLERRMVIGDWHPGTVDDGVCQAPNLIVDIENQLADLPAVRKNENPGVLSRYPVSVSSPAGLCCGRRSACHAPPSCPSPSCTPWSASCWTPY